MTSCARSGVNHVRKLNTIRFSNRAAQRCQQSSVGEESSCRTESIRLFLAIVLLVVLGGCSRGPKLVPVSGQVSYRDKPLEFGAVMFQPEEGQPARGYIQPDGTFTLSTRQDGKDKQGAVIGEHLVRITCYEGQRVEATGEITGETSLGRLLIPEKYTMFDETGLTVEVREQNNEPFIFELSDD